MLRHDVVDAVKEGRFHVYSVGHVDEATALLSGIAAGQRGSDAPEEPKEELSKVNAEGPESGENARSSLFFRHRQRICGSVEHIPPDSFLSAAAV